MTTLKEDAKDVGLALVFDFLLVAFILCWVLALLLALLEVTLWVVFGVFLLGCGIFFLVLYFSKKNEEKEKEKEDAVKEESEIFE